MYCAGVMFWQWGMGPFNSDSNNIEVAAHDVDYTTIVIPAATAALASAQDASPIPNCTKVRVHLMRVQLDAQLPSMVTSAAVCSHQSPAVTLCPAGVLPV